MSLNARQLLALVLLGLEEFALTHQQEADKDQPDAWLTLEIEENDHRLILLGQTITPEDILLFRRLIRIMQEQTTNTLYFSPGPDQEPRELQRQIMALAGIHLHLQAVGMRPPLHSVEWHGLFAMAWVDQREGLIRVHLDPLLYPVIRG